MAQTVNKHYNNVWPGLKQFIVTGYFFNAKDLRKEAIKLETSVVLVEI